MQACEGYVENGQFFPIGATIKTTGRLRAFLTILDEPTQLDFKDIKVRNNHYEAFFGMLSAESFSEITETLKDTEKIDVDEW